MLLYLRQPDSFRAGCCFFAAYIPLIFSSCYTGYLFLDLFSVFASPRSLSRFLVCSALFSALLSCCFFFVWAAACGLQWFFKHTSTHTAPTNPTSYTHHPRQRKQWWSIRISLQSYLIAIWRRLWYWAFSDHTTTHTHKTRHAAHAHTTLAINHHRPLFSFPFVSFSCFIFLQNIQKCLWNIQCFLYLKLNNNKNLVNDLFH